MISSNFQEVLTKFNRSKIQSFKAKNAEVTFLSPLGITASSAYLSNNTEYSETAFFQAMHYLRHRITIEQQSETPKIGNLMTLHIMIRNKIVCSNMGLIGKCISMSNCRLDYETMFGAGQHALMDAVDSFDPWMGWKFSTYASSAILRRFVREAKNQYRLPIQDAVDTNSVEENLRTPKNNKTEFLLEKLHQVISERQGGLTDSDLEILNLRFSLNSDSGKKTLREIAENRQLSKERIRQLQNCALDKLKAALELHL